MKKLCTLIAALMAACLLLAACGSKSPAASSQPASQAGSGAASTAAPAGDGKVYKLGIALEKYDDNFMSYLRRAIEAAAEGHTDIELMMNDAQRDQAKMNEQIDIMLEKGVDALAVNLVNVEAAPSVIEKAKAKNVPVVFFNKDPGEDVMNSYDLTYYVGTSLPESGIMQGEMVADAWEANIDKFDRNGDGKIQYVLLQGDPGHPDAVYRAKYVVDTLKERGIELEELEFQSGMWDSAKAKELMDAWYTKHGDKIEFVFAGNDSMALGAIQSLRAVGYFDGDKYMPIVGVDAIPEALEEIRKGVLLGTVLNDAKNQGLAVLELTYNMARGMDAVEGTQWKLDGRSVFVPYVPITKENIAVAEAAYS